MLQRELAKSEIGLTEFLGADYTKETGIDSMTLEKKMIRQFSEISAKALAVVLSVKQLDEWWAHFSEKYAGSAKGRANEIQYTEWETLLSKLCRESFCPVILITDSETQEQELAAFEAGVCDYFGREKAVSICVKRILACWRKRQQEEFVHGRENTLYVDRKKQSVFFAGEEIPCSPKEYQALLLLWEREGELLLKEELFSRVWGERPPKCRRVVDTLIKQLRKKLKGTPYVIQTKYKKGYSLRNLGLYSGF